MRSMLLRVVSLQKPVLPTAVRTVFLEHRPAPIIPHPETLRSFPVPTVLPKQGLDEAPPDGPFLLAHCLPTCCSWAILLSGSCQPPALHTPFSLPQHTPVPFSRSYTSPLPDSYSSFLGPHWARSGACHVLPSPALITLYGTYMCHWPAPWTALSVQKMGSVLCTTVSLQLRTGCGIERNSRTFIIWMNR